MCSEADLVYASAENWVDIYICKSKSRACVHLRKLSALSSMSTEVLPFSKTLFGALYTNTATQCCVLCAPDVSLPGSSTSASVKCLPSPCNSPTYRPLASNSSGRSPYLFTLSILLISFSYASTSSVVTVGMISVLLFSSSALPPMGRLGMLVGRAIAGTACGFGISVVRGRAVSFDFRGLLRSNKRIRGRIIATRVRPPTTPTIIAPILDLKLEVL